MAGPVRSDMRPPYRRRTTGDGGQDRQLVAGREASGHAVEVLRVVPVHEEVDVATEPPCSSRTRRSTAGWVPANASISESTVPPSGHVDLDVLGPSGQVAQRTGQADGDRQPTSWRGRRAPAAGGGGDLPGVAGVEGAEELAGAGAEPQTGGLAPSWQKPSRRIVRWA